MLITNPNKHIEERITMVIASKSRNIGFLVKNLEAKTLKRTVEKLTPFTILF